MSDRTETYGRVYRTRVGHRATLNHYGWDRADFSYLGIIETKDGHKFGWAWRADGRSIDTIFPEFDLVDFPNPPAPDRYHHWLGKGGE